MTGLSAGRRDHRAGPESRSWVMGGNQFVEKDWSGRDKWVGDGQSQRIK